MSNILCPLIKPDLKKTIKIIALFGLLLTATTILAQNNLLTSTLDSAKALRDAGKYQQAVKVLQTFDNKYPDNYWVLQLYAETLFWMKEYEEADHVYRRSIRVYPDNYELKYEYALFLYDRGDYKNAHELLLLYNEKYPDITEVQSLLGITGYYLGNFKAAKVFLESSLKKNPNDKFTRKIYTEVSHIVNPWFKGDFLYTKDSQPMSLLMPQLSGGWYHSHLLNLSFKVNYQSFSADSLTSDMSGFSLQNSFIIPNAGFKAVVGLGGFYTAINNTMDITWQLQIDKRLTKNLHIKAGGERSPYTYTVSSIAKPFLRNRYSASLSWETENNVNANIGYIGEFFPDTNQVHTAYAWVLSPTFKFSVFRVNAGYAFNYSNAGESRFVSEQPLDDILTDYDSTKQITGVYNPYFTPNNQFSNSLLVNLYVVPSDRVNIKLHASVGVFSRAMNPYLYLDKRNGKTIINEGFYQEKFTPLDIGFDLNANLSDKIILNLSYQYLQTFYYNTNNFNVGLKIYF